MKKISVIGLGAMGGAIARKFHQAQLLDAVYDTRHAAAAPFSTTSVSVCNNVEALVEKAHAIWLMVPAPAVEALIPALQKLPAGSIIVDGGNSHYTDSRRRAELFSAQQISFLDCGASGGLWGAEHGFSMTIGGAEAAFQQMTSFFKAIAYNNTAYVHVGPSGAGHFVKMVHNGIEYALMQAYADGIMLLNDGTYPQLDLAQITAAWQQGAIVRSWILELMHELLAETPSRIDHTSGAVQETGMGRWCVEEAARKNIPIPLIEAAVELRGISRETGGNFGTQLIALLRNKMGGHPIQPRTGRTPPSRT